MKVVAGLLAAIVLAAGCGDDGNGGAEGTTTTGAVGSATATTAAANADVCTADRTPGNLRVAEFTQPPGLDVLAAAGGGATGSNILAAIYDTLMVFDQTTRTFVPKVAKSLEPNADFTVWTLGLRDGVKFGNGDPLTAADVKASTDRLQSADNKRLTRAQLQIVTKTEVVDPMTVRFTLPPSAAYFGWLLADEPGMIVNPRVVASMAPAALNLLPTGAGVGPFEPVRYAQGEEIVLRGKDNWWGGPVCIGEIRFVYPGSGQAMYDGMKRNELDVAFMREGPVIAQAKKDGYEGRSTLQSGAVNLVFNRRVSPTNDKRVRQAITLAVDPAVVNNRAEGGTGVYATSLLPKVSQLYTLPGVTPDANAAKALVAEAKTALNWDGSLELVCNNTPVWTERSIAIKAQLDAAGFKTTVVNVPGGELSSRVSITNNYQLGCWGLSFDESNPSLGLQPYLSSSQNNPAAYANPAFDQLILDLRKAKTAADKATVMGQIQKLWNDDAPVAVLAAQENFVAFQKKVHGLYSGVDDTVRFDKAYVQ